MTDKTTKTLPQDVHDRALAAIASIRTWNAAVYHARAMEALAGQEGRYEYDIMTDDAHMDMRFARSHGAHALDEMEHMMRGHGWSLDAFYQAIGQPRPAILAEGPEVARWHRGQR